MPVCSVPRDAVACGIGGYPAPHSPTIEFGRCRGGGSPCLRSKAQSPCRSAGRSVRFLVRSQSLPHSPNLPLRPSQCATEKTSGVVYSSRDTSHQASSPWCKVSERVSSLPLPPLLSCVSLLRLVVRVLRSVGGSAGDSSSSSAGPCSSPTGTPSFFGSLDFCNTIVPELATRSESLLPSVVQLVQHAGGAMVVDLDPAEGSDAGLCDEHCTFCCGVAQPPALHDLDSGASSSFSASAASVDRMGVDEGDGWCMWGSVRDAVVMQSGGRTDFGCSIPISVASRAAAHAFGPHVGSELGDDDEPLVVDGSVECAVPAGGSDGGDVGGGGGSSCGDTNSSSTPLADQGGLQLLRGHSLPCVREVQPYPALGVRGGGSGVNVFALSTSLKSQTRTALLDLLVFGALLFTARLLKAAAGRLVADAAVVDSACVGYAARVSDCERKLFTMGRGAHKAALRLARISANCRA